MGLHHLRIDQVFYDLWRVVRLWPVVTRILNTVSFPVLFLINAVSAEKGYRQYRNSTLTCSYSCFIWLATCSKLPGNKNDLVCLFLLRRKFYAVVVSSFLFSGPRLVCYHMDLFSPYSSHSHSNDNHPASEHSYIKGVHLSTLQ